MTQLMDSVGDSHINQNPKSWKSMGSEAYLVMEGETSCITDGQTFMIDKRSAL